MVSPRLQESGGCKSNFETTDDSESQSSVASESASLMKVGGENGGEILVTSDL